MTVRSYNELAAITASHCRNVIDELDINDIRSNVTAAVIEQQHINLANLLLANGYVKAVFLTTTPPDPTSTDGYATLGNQTAGTNDAARVAINDWKRTVPAPFAGVIETADPVESSRDSGKVTVAGGGSCGAGGGVAQQNVVMCDGLHYSTYGVGLILSSVGNISGMLK